MESKIKISSLVTALNEYTTGQDAIFEGSGMLNSNGKDRDQYGCLDFGFFPYGSGILVDNKLSDVDNATIETGGVMFLGNDFGCEKYLENCLINRREESTNLTISNVLKLVTSEDLDQCFFTNFFIGLREGNSNLKRENEIKNCYSIFCYEVFKLQLQFIKPDLVVVMGKDVAQELNRNSNVFNNWFKHNYKSLEIMNDNKFTFEKMNGYNCRFCYIPHPSSFRNIQIEKQIQKFKESIKYANN